ncbi:STAS domain-containing protein [Mycobacterium sp. KBS0706]|nr:STAS domain-containing protein [Mycobacterium sp. KBS0706]
MTGRPRSGVGFATRTQPGPSERHPGRSGGLDVQGKVTLGTGDVELRNAVQQALNGGANNILLNLGGVSVIDSSGIGEFVASYTSVANRGGKLMLVSLPPKVNDILAITQMITVFDVYDSETEAVAAFK